MKARQLELKILFVLGIFLLLLLLFVAEGSVSKLFTTLFLSMVMLPTKEIIIVQKKDSVIIKSKYAGMLSEDIIGLIDDEERYKIEQVILNCKQIKTQRIF